MLMTVIMVQILPQVPKAAVAVVIKKTNIADDEVFHVANGAALTESVHHFFKLTLVLCPLGFRPYVAAARWFSYPPIEGMVLSVLLLGPGPELVVVVTFVVCIFHLRLLKL